MTDKVTDETEALRQEVRRLKSMVGLISRDVRKVTRKYLRDLPPGRLPFESFLELLMARARKDGRGQAMQDVVNGMLRTKMDAVVTKLVPSLQKKFRESLYVPVLVRVNDEPPAKFKATSLRGSHIRTHKGRSPEEAYAKLRDAIEAVARRTPELLLQFNPELVKDYDAAKFWQEDKIAGFRAIVRVQEGGGE